MQTEAFMAGYMHKEAGRGTKILGALNPLNLVAGNLGGLVAAGFTDTQTPEEASKGNTGAWNAVKDILLPGRAAHSIYKTTGSIMNHPEFEKVKEHLRRLGKDKRHDDFKDINRLTQDMHEKIIQGEYHKPENTRTMEALLEMVRKQRAAHGYDKETEKKRELLEEGAAASYA